MAGIGEIFGSMLIVLGAFFYVVGAIGIYRMPDVFTRMHAAGISDTVGAGLLIFGMMCFAGFSLVTVKLAIILGIIFFTSPIATHALAQAALHAGVEPILATKKILIGPGAHSEQADTPIASKKSAAKVAKRRSTSSSVKRKAKRSGQKRRARS